MKSLVTAVLFLFVLTSSNAQNISASEVLNKSIAFHDPQGNWPTFNGELQVTMVTPKRSPRLSVVNIDLPSEKFQLKQSRDSVETRYYLEKGECTTTVTDSLVGKRTPCEMAVFFKDYYTYLYGLPMKLKDPGTIVNPIAERVNFKGKEYLKISVKYDEAVGTDVWQFYFDPKTYAMEVYQFFKGDPEGKGKNTGEYILLKDLKTINNIQFPQAREWYYNKDNTYLGTDKLG
ncbi:DUF6503 family protein [Patiriisocius marinus]|uniref:Uncharacterized protein n=1 Tax=Patiriisocius marinus TaxID=1397112 RepID=A0A5J4IUL3_9FLAO|nr:DUF6503 family protein [Patiriisocius marinus]GER58406.1 hypothetical protein ULMA_05140 [Patiriisocius marinus]